MQKNNIMVHLIKYSKNADLLIHAAAESHVDNSFILSALKGHSIHGLIYMKRVNPLSYIITT